MKYYFNKEDYGFLLSEENVNEQKFIEITEQEYAEIMYNIDHLMSPSYSIRENKLIVTYTPIIPSEEENLNYLRTERNVLLEAFDKWEKAVLRGREQDDLSIMNWYYDLLDLKETAFANVPSEIKYYL